MAKRKYNFFDKLILPLAVVFAILLLLATVAGQIDPRKSIMIAFLGLSYPFLLLFNGCFLFWWIFRKKVVFALVTLVVIGVGYKVLHATFGFLGDTGPAEKVKTAIRVMTYNVHSFKLFGEENSLSAKDGMLEVIKNENPDIICFQEFFTRSKGKYNTIDSLKKLLNVKYFYYRPVYDNSYESFGLAIFSKYPIKNKGEVLFDGFGDNMSIYADVEINGKLVRVYDVHFQSISFQSQDYAFIDELTKKKSGKVTGMKRILRMLKYAFERRSSQVDKMKAEMAQCKLPYFIAGDFNDTPASYVVTQITAGLNNSFIEKGSGFGKTYNGKFPNFQIDYIASTKQLSVLNYKIIPAKLSDHFPIRVDFKLN
ncbi:endonuclease/exonuclease/phosphatase family protein [Pedobacter sp. MW01-1-1]|uniref:endonuclease/exonuclease/phosphatase family protein n=1 Tax=Pedobacter sp. MW01-1-1 TaxID=3383027 RepID=UPI003FEF2211